METQTEKAKLPFPMAIATKVALKMVKFMGRVNTDLLMVRCTREVFIVDQWMVIVQYNSTKNQRSMPIRKNMKYWKNMKAK